MIVSDFSWFGQNGLRSNFFEQMSTMFDSFFFNGLFRKIQIEDWEFDFRWQGLILSGLSFDSFNYVWNQCLGKLYLNQAKPWVRILMETRLGHFKNECPFWHLVARSFCLGIFFNNSKKASIAKNVFKKQLNVKMQNRERGRKTESVGSKKI